MTTCSSCAGDTANKRSAARAFEPSLVRDVYRLTFGLAIGASVGDAATSWWMQYQGAAEMSPVLIAVKSAAGLLGMIAVIVVVKALALALVAALWRAALSLGTLPAEWATAAVSTIVCFAALIPVLHNLAAWLQPV